MIRGTLRPELQQVAQKPVVAWVHCRILNINATFGTQVTEGTVEYFDPQMLTKRREVRALC